MTIQTTNSLSPALAAHLEQVDWGFQDGVRYRILERRAMLDGLLPHGEFRLLREGERLVGTIFSLHKTISLGNGQTVAARYETLLSVHPEEHGKGLAKRLIQAARPEPSGRIVQYAYIEEKNLPSASAFRAQGYEIIGQFLVTTWNRLRPELSPRANPLTEPHEPHIRSGLADLYRDHGFTDLDVSFRPNHYWVLLDSGKPVSGVQIDEEVWSITSMPGPDGWLTVHVLPHLPLLSRILNPRHIPVLKLSHLYVPEGRENEFTELAIHLTRHYRKTLALAYLDPGSPVYRRLKKNTRFGIFNPLFETPVNIWARLQGFTAQEVALLKQQPFVISPFDIS